MFEIFERKICTICRTVPIPREHTESVKSALSRNAIAVIEFSGVADTTIRFARVHARVT